MKIFVAHGAGLPSLDGLLARASVGYKLTSLELEVDSKDTIAEVKESISNITGIPVEKQIFFYGWRTLEDKNSLEDYNIQPFATLYFKTDYSTTASSAEKDNRFKNEEGVVNNQEEEWEAFTSAAKTQLNKELENKKLLFIKMKEDKSLSLEKIVVREAKIQADSKSIDDDLWKMACKEKDIEASKQIVYRKKREIQCLEEKIGKDTRERMRLLSVIDSKRTKRDNRRKEVLDLSEKIEQNDRDMKQLLANEEVGSVRSFLAESIVQKEALLECPVCFEIACPPIYKCSREHLICSQCLPRMDDKCPTCRCGIGGSDKSFRMAEIFFHDLQKMKEKLETI